MAAAAHKPVLRVTLPGDFVHPVSGVFLQGIRAQQLIDFDVDGDATLPQPMGFQVSRLSGQSGVLVKRGSLPISINEPGVQ